MRRILVLGGNGFIGKNLCDYLASKGEEVYSFDIKNPEKRNKDVIYCEGDFFDDYTLKNIVKDKDVIFHAICTLNPGNSNDKYIMGYERDFIQTIKLCDFIKDSDTKMIFLSSGGTVYGNQEVMPISEDTFPKPINHYGNLKLCIENTIRTINYQAKKKMIIARIANPYGPGQDYCRGVGFIDAVIRRTLEHTDIEIWGDGSVVRDYIYIEDVCKMLYALVGYEGQYDVFNLSSDQGKSQNEIIELVKKINPEVNVVYKNSRTVDAKKIVLDNSRIMSEIDIDITDIEDGIRMYYDYLVKMKAMVK